MLSVFNIQRYSLHDGSGVRTTVFFKGCQLHCQWCNNPESIDPFPSIMFDERLCQAFGDCIKAGEGYIVQSGGTLRIDREQITGFSRLRDACPSKALQVVGRMMSIEEIMSEIRKDIPFYNASGGGVTISGGEPFAQDPLLAVLLSEIKAEGINVSAETSLHVSWENIERCLPYVDVFLADLKHSDPSIFRQFTGGSLELVLSNFKNLDLSGKTIVVRVPVIPEFNFSETELKLIIDFAAGLENANEVNFIPFHSLAREKYAMLGKEYIFGNRRNVEKHELLPFAVYAEKKGLTAKILN